MFTSGAVISSMASSLRAAVLFICMSVRELAHAKDTSGEAGVELPET